MRFGVGVVWWVLGLELVLEGLGTSWICVWGCWVVVDHYSRDELPPKVHHIGLQSLIPCVAADLQLDLFAQRARPPPVKEAAPTTDWAATPGAGGTLGPTVSVGCLFPQ